MNTVLLNIVDAEGHPASGIWDFDALRTTNDPDKRDFLSYIDSAIKNDGSGELPYHLQQKSIGWPEEIKFPAIGINVVMAVTLYSEN